MKKAIAYILVFLVAFIVMDQIAGRIISNGIRKFYGLQQHAEILIVGHSHLMLALNKEQLEKETGSKVSKYTREGVSVYDRYYMVRQFLDSPYSDSLKIVLYGVDRFSFIKSGLSENAYKLFYPFMDDKIMDDYVRENATSVWDYYEHKLFQSTRFSDALLNASVRGYRNDFSNYKSGQIDIESLRTQMAEGHNRFYRKIEMDSSLIAVFKQTIDLLTNRGIRVVLVNTPLLDLMNQMEPEAGQQVIRFFSDYAETHPNVEYWDLNPQYESEYAIFFDPIHLNPEGQKRITSEIINRLDHLNQIR